MKGNGTNCTANTVQKWIGYLSEAYIIDQIPRYSRKDGKRYYVQVAYSVENEKAYTREFSAFGSLSQIDKKILITNDELDYSTSNVEHIRLKEFLLADSL